LSWKRWDAGHPFSTIVLDDFKFSTLTLESTKSPSEEDHQMADEISMALDEFVRKAQLSDDVDFLRDGVRALAQALMEAEVTQQVGAGRYERTPKRTGERNGNRERRWDTRVGSITLRVPRVRDGSYFPSLLEPRRRAERALVAVVQEAYVHGVSTRRVDELVQALGLQGISKSQVSVLCAELDGEVERFRTRPLGEAPYPYVWLDATYIKARMNGHVASQAVVIAIGLNAATGTREVLGLDVGPSEDGAFWLTFLRGLVARGLSGVQLVVSDAHEGLKAAIAAVLYGAGWQRCRVHFVRCCLGLGAQSSSAAGCGHHSDGVCPPRARAGSAGVAADRRWVPLPLSQARAVVG
jgi:transposase-like protein